MMLSLSANTTETAFDLQMVNGSAASDSQEIPFAGELVNFAEAIAERDAGKIDRTRDELTQVAGSLSERCEDIENYLGKIEAAV